MTCFIVYCHKLFTLTFTTRLEVRRWVKDASIDYYPFVSRQAVWNRWRPAVSPILQAITKSSFHLTLLLTCRTQKRNIVPFLSLKNLLLGHSSTPEEFLPPATFGFLYLFSILREFIYLFICPIQPVELIDCRFTQQEVCNVFA